MSKSEMKQSTETVYAEETPEFIMTKAGFMVVGSEYVGDKLTALICEAVNSFDKSNISTIVLRNDGWPASSLRKDDDTEFEEVFGVCTPDTNSIAINLNRCWDHACAVAMENSKNLSFLGILWTAVLSAVAHELDHLVIASTDRPLYEAMRLIDDGKDLEDAALEAERQLICTLARDIDTEIPAPADLGWLGLKWMGLHTDKDTKDLGWVIKARQMAEAGIIYEEKENDLIVKSFRKFVEMAYEQAGVGWEQATSPINLTVYLDSGETKVLPAEPVAPLSVETVDPAATIEAAETMIEMVQRTEAGSMFVGAGTIVDSDGPDVVMTDAVAADGSATIGFTAPPVELQAENVVGMEVPLTPPIAAQQQVFATAATTAAPAPAAPTPTTYAPCALDNTVMPQVLEQVWKALYHHIFTKCGWSQNPTTGRFFFSNAAAVLEGVNIQHILTQFGADGFIMEYDTLNSQGQPEAENCQGMIRGYTTSKQGLPAYALYLNIGGQRYKRSFLPQNPEKRNAQNAYSNSANDAAAGNQIAWIFKDEVADAAQFTEKCAVKITNSVNGIVYEVIS